MSTSQQIRDLHKQGFTKGQIAKKLGIRFQFVYNVLKRDQDQEDLKAYRAQKS